MGKLIKKSLSAFFVFFAVVLIIFACGGCSNVQKEVEQPQGEKEVIVENTFPELSIISEEQKEDMVVISTTFGDFEYAYAFYDILKYHVENKEGKALFSFFAEIHSKEYPVYTIYFNEEKGIRLGTMHLDGWDENIVVSVEFFDPEGIDDQDIVTFNAAQETFSEIILSMEKNKNFSSEM